MGATSRQAIPGTLHVSRRQTHAFYGECDGFVTLSGCGPHRLSSSPFRLRPFSTPRHKRISLQRAPRQQVFRSFTACS